MRLFLLHSFLVAPAEKSRYCFPHIIPISPEGFSTGGAVFFSIFSVGEEITLTFSTPGPVCASKVTQAEATGMRAVRDKQRAAHVCSFVPMFPAGKVPPILYFPDQEPRSWLQFHQLVQYLVQTRTEPSWAGVRLGTSGNEDSPARGTLRAPCCHRLENGKHFQYWVAKFNRSYYYYGLSCYSRAQGWRHPCSRLAEGRAEQLCRPGKLLREAAGLPSTAAEGPAPREVSPRGTAGPGSTSGQGHRSRCRRLNPMSHLEPCGRSPGKTSQQITLLEVGPCHPQLLPARRHSTSPWGLWWWCRCWKSFGKPSHAVFVRWQINLSLATDMLFHLSYWSLSLNDQNNNQGGSTAAFSTFQYI